MEDLQFERMKREAAAKADELARAAWPEAHVGLSKKHLAEKGIEQVYELTKGLVVLFGRNQHGPLYFRGSLDAAMIWLAEQPAAEPHKHFDPLADLRASVNERLASLAADAATIVKKDRAP